ncbi:MAG: metallophosphoesterase [Clostridia bacterium]|nr:metallophosphoesterase [Clostridia bacterium]
MAVYVIADPHLSFGTDKPMNIFRGWDRHAEKMQENWLATVRPEDAVVLPGDISWAMTPEQALADLQFLHELPGTKIIGKGNHDYWWATMRKMTALAEEHGLSSLRFLFNNAFLADGIAVCGTRGWFFDAEADAQGEKIILREAGRLRASLTAGQALGGTLTAFLHYPAAADGRVCAPLMEVLHEFGVKRCYFGHLHGQNTARYDDFTVEEIRFSLVSADHLQFCPLRVEF